MQGNTIPRPRLGTGLGWMKLIAPAACLLAGWGLATLASAQERDSDPMPKSELLGLVKQLDSSRFLDRESATIALIEQGNGVVPVLLEVLPQLSAEGRFRSLIVLEHLSSDRRRDAQRAARAAIEELAKADNSSLAQAAELSLHRINRWRAEKTLEDLAAEGATVEYRTQYLTGQTEQVPNLVRIDDEWQGDVATLDRLAWLQNVNQIELHGKRITNDTVKYAMEVEGLSSLRLKDATISDALWIELAEQDKLIPLFELEVKYCPLSDRSLEAIGQMRTLQLVSLFGTNVTQTGAMRLKQQLPGTEVDYRQGGFLGVRGINDRGADLTSTRCLISSIEPNSAAARSRLKPGDIIVSANGKEVTTIEDLINVARPLQPGDPITLKIERGSETFEERIELGRWE